jgi:hypothetical protein
MTNDNFGRKFTDQVVLTEIPWAGAGAPRTRRSTLERPWTFRSFFIRHGGNAVCSFTRLPLKRSTTLQELVTTPEDSYGL